MTKRQRPRTSVLEPWGTRIRNRRLALGLTQVDVANRTKLTQQAISRIEKNKSIPQLHTAHLLAEAYGTTVDELFPADAILQTVAS